MENNKPIIFLVVIFVIVLTAYGIIRTMAPSRTPGSGSDRTIHITEVSETPAASSPSGQTPSKSYSSSNSPRLMSVQETENQYDSYYQDMEEQQQILTESSRKRQEFIAGMNGRAGLLFKEGLDFAASQDYDKAIDSFLKALREEPNNMTIRLLAFKKLAALYKQKNDDKKYYVSTFKYLEVLEKIEKNPDEVENIRNLKNDIKGKLATLGE
ncbi:MAG TPA: tetratricopeptide repeat protein [Candidatus Wallbacteria bacterium]|nr:tetratricopeptide repeat protein [Candidatus Wallbacteria bacterium]